MTNRLTPAFNMLSGADRVKLRAATALVALSAVVHEDTRDAPWKFPFYLAFMILIALPIPVPGSNVVPVALAFGWFRLGLTERARLADQQVRTQFDPAVMIETHAAHIESDPARPEGFRVRGLALAFGANKRAWRDMKAAGQIFYHRTLDFFG